MNKQSMGMYVILGLLVVSLISTFLMQEQPVKISEISYSNFLLKLENKEFSKIEKYKGSIY